MGGWVRASLQAVGGQLHWVHFADTQVSWPECRKGVDEKSQEENFLLLFFFFNIYIHAHRCVCVWVYVCT